MASGYGGELGAAKLASRKVTFVTGLQLKQLNAYGANLKPVADEYLTQVNRNQAGLMRITKTSFTRWRVARKEKHEVF